MFSIGQQILQRRSPWLKDNTISPAPSHRCHRIHLNIMVSIMIARTSNLPLFVWRCSLSQHFHPTRGYHFFEHPRKTCDATLLRSIWPCWHVFLIETSMPGRREYHGHSFCFICGQFSEMYVCENLRFPQHNISCVLHINITPQTKCH